MTTRRWMVEIELDEHPQDRYTRAEARLHTGDPTDIRVVGRSSRNPSDPEVPEIGDELAAARALASLAERLRRAALAEVEAVSDQGSHGW